MSEQTISFDTGGINYHVNQYIASLGDLSGRKVLDCPAGDGRTSYQFEKAGAQVTSADLFPQFFKLPNNTCDEVNLKNGLPYEDESFDIAICQEGIEHMQDQLFVLQEFSRVLKKDGLLIITAPNISQLRAKVSFLLCESDYYKRAAANEMDSVWFSEKESDQLYFGHVFLVNAQKLRTLGVFSGLEFGSFVKTDISSTSLLLFPFLYPFILLYNLFPFIFYSKKLKHIKEPVRKAVLKEQFLINCSPTSLVCKHTFMTFKKVRSHSQTLSYLKSLTRH